MLTPDRIEAGFLERYSDHILTIDSHTQGEPTRLLISDSWDLHGTTMKEKRADFQARYDHLRLLLTQEPRGHRDMFAAAVVEPVSPSSRFGLIYMDAERYPYLCGHATIGAVTTLIETGIIEAREGRSTVTIDSPSGQLEAMTIVKNGKVESVALDMVPSFVMAHGRELEITGYGKIPVDLVCVGGVFAMVSASVVDIRLVAENSRKLVDLGMQIIAEANNYFEIVHPERPEVKTVDVTEFYDGDPASGEGTSVVVYGKSHMDRSPCGTGTTAKMTLLHQRGHLDLDQPYRNRSPLGTWFEGRIIGTCRIGSFQGIRARVSGSAHITGLHRFVLDDQDPFPEGFLL
jgi:proline racemase